MTKALGAARPSFAPANRCDMAPRRHRSITGPIISGSISVALTVALLIGWIYVILKNQELTQQWVGNLWLLVAGVISFVTIMTVLILFSVFLARQILEIRRQTTFVDSVTHELRSPLASLRLCLQTLGREGLNPSHREHLREMMLSDVERLSAFIDDILEANRIEHGGRGRTQSTFELEPLVQRSVGSVCRRHKLEPESIELDIEPNLQLATDPGALEIILKNLLDNAVKYSDPPPRVRVHAYRRDKHVVLEVRDRGVGIPKRLLKRIFDRFYRVDEEVIRARRGTGLGLFVVKALVVGLGGKLSAHSDGPGEGTTVTVVLPARKHGASVTPVRDNSEGHGRKALG